MDRILTRSTLAVAALVIVAACGGQGATNAPGTNQPSAAPNSGAPSSPGAGVSGQIFVSGSSTVEPISLAVSEAFRTANPGFGFTVEGPGTGDGFAKFCAGETDVADASRAIRDEEIQQCADAGIEYTELLIAYDGITVMTHPDTPVDCLTTADLYALFGPESDNIATWADAGPMAAELGSTTTMPDLPLQITAPGEESGTYDAFLELAGIDDLGVERGVFTEDDSPYLRVPGANYTASPNDNVIVEGVEAGAGALGFVGFAYFEEAGDRVKALAIDGGEGCVEPSIETIGDGSYPLSRPLFIYVNNAKADENPALAAWTEFFLSDEGIANVSAVGYVELPEADLEAARDAWAGR